MRIDACRDCRGVWLDRGELDRVYSDHESHRRHKKRKSFLDELFA